jgi:hypothetical protein
MIKAKAAPNQKGQKVVKSKTNLVTNPARKTEKTDDPFPEYISFTKDYLFFGDVIESIEQYVTGEYLQNFKRDKECNDADDTNENYYFDNYEDEDEEGESENIPVTEIETDSHFESRFDERKYINDRNSENDEEEYDERVISYYRNMMDDVSYVVYMLEKKKYFTYDIKKIKEQIDCIEQNCEENYHQIKLSLRVILTYLENIYKTVNCEDF